MTRQATFPIRTTLIAMILLFPGCHGSGTPEKGTSGTSEQGGRPLEAAAAAEPTVSVPPGVEAATPRLTLPEDFPAAVPLLPHRRIGSFSPRQDGSVSLTYSVESGTRETAGQYREILAGHGWDLTLDSISGGMTSLSARQDDGSLLTVNIIGSRDQGRTMIGLYHCPAPQPTLGAP